MNKKSISNPKFDNELEKKIRKFKNFFLQGQSVSLSRIILRV